jgi:hypothetical protein
MIVATSLYLARSKASCLHGKSQEKKIVTRPENFTLGFSIIKGAKFNPAYENNTLILLMGLPPTNPAK